MLYNYSMPIDQKNFRTQICNNHKLQKVNKNLYCHSKVRILFEIAEKINKITDHDVHHTRSHAKLIVEAVNADYVVQNIQIMNGPSVYLMQRP